MQHLEDNMAHGASRIRTPNEANIKEDLELLKKGILDHHSFLSGYEYHNHPMEFRVTDQDGKLKQVCRTHNLRTNVGTADQGHIMSDSAYAGGRAYYVGLTTTQITPSTTELVLSGELTGSGLGRVASTFLLSSSPTTASAQTQSGQYQLRASWTSASATVVIWGCAVFNASTSGDMWFEAAIASPGVTVNNTDTLSLTYTINY